MASFKLVTDQNIGTGLKIASAKLQADLGAGLMFNGNAIVVDPATLPLTVTLTNPSGTNLQVGVNGNLSGLLDLTPAIQAGETTTTLTYNPATKTLTYTNEDGTVANVDLSALATDIYVNGGSYDAATMVLTLTDNDATTPDITINLADLKKVVSQASSAISFTGTGEASSPLQASLNLDPLAGNLLKVTASGIKVDPADITVTSGVGITGNGQSATPIEFDASELPIELVDPSSVNDYLVMSRPASPKGVRIGVLEVADEMWYGYNESMVGNKIGADVPAIISALLTVDVQDLAGTHLFYALP